MWYGMNWQPAPPAWKPEPQKRSESTLSVPTGNDWQRRPCWACCCAGCPSCNNRGVGWVPDRDLKIMMESGSKPPKPHPLEGRFRRDEEGKWFRAPLQVNDIVGGAHASPMLPSAFGTSPTKRIEIPPHPGPDSYFGGP